MQSDSKNDEWFFHTWPCVSVIPSCHIMFVVFLPLEDKDLWALTLFLSLQITPIVLNYGLTLNMIASLKIVLPMESWIFK